MPRSALSGRAGRWEKFNEIKGPSSGLGVARGVLSKRGNKSHAVKTSFTTVTFQEPFMNFAFKPLAFAALTLAVSLSATAAQIPSQNTDSLSVQSLIAKRGADDAAGHKRRGRGADDGANHARRGRGADDGAGHQRRGRGADDGANHS
jgi:hypothetical protein